MKSQADNSGGDRGQGLHVAVHDVAPCHLSRLQRIDDILEGLGISGRYSMLVVPDFHRRNNLDDHPEFAGWLRRMGDRGAEMLLHGFSHLDESSHPTLLARWKAGAMTAGEGEFLGLDAGQAARRLAEGRRMVEGAVGRPVNGFVAPAWLYGAAVRGALASEGFRLAEDHWTVWSPAEGRTLLRSPVVSWASRTPTRLASSILWSRIATLVLRPLRIVRVGIHPGDLSEPRLEREIKRTIASFLARREPCLLGDLLSSFQTTRGQ